MPEATEIAQTLVFALRKIEANANGALQGGRAKEALEAIRDAAGKAAADAAQQLKMPPYDGN
jgi:hypothetical protein